MEILLLTGACGVGKTSTAKAWAKQKNGAIIECDYFTEWIFKTDFPQWSPEEEIFVANLAAMNAKEYVKNEMSVAIENVWSPKGIKLLLTQLQQEPLIKSIKAVWLQCDSEENHRRDELRIPDNQMKERLDVVDQELRGYQWPAYVHPLDTTHLSLEQSIQKIEALSSI